MSLSLYRRLTSLDLTPTTISIQLADCSIRQLVGILEDLPVRVGEFVVPCDFFVVDMEESPDMPLILGRPFLTIAGAEINVQAGTLSFCICGERVDFCFPPPIPTPAPATSPPLPAPVPAAPPKNFISITVFNGDRGPDLWATRYADPVSILTSLGIPSAHTGEVLYPTAPFYTFLSPPPESSPFIIWR